jgi:23S rRNA pseudouridine955/2504/2580 synthase/23S rRNA pseudouridine1911/1915/1917 synthase
VSRNIPVIIFENDDFIAIDKPSGLLTIPDRTQSEVSLKEKLQQSYTSIFTVHRLDKETSGIVLFAKNEAMHKWLSQAFENRNVEKYYIGIVHGKPYESSGLIDAPIAEHGVKKGFMTVNRNGKESLTGYEVMESYPQYSQVLFRLHTGRTHQLRVHSKHIGHPLACDPLYGDGKPLLLSSIKKKYNPGKTEEEKPILNRLALHSYQLKFTSENGETFELTAPLPKEFKALMQQLKKLN